MGFCISLCDRRTPVLRWVKSLWKRTKPRYLTLSRSQMRQYHIAVSYGLRGSTEKARRQPETGLETHLAVRTG